MATNKFSTSLQQYLKKIQQLESSGTAAIEVIVELKNEPALPVNTLSKQEKIKLIKKKFNTEIEAINHTLINSGAKIIDTAWINKTVKMAIPVSHLEKLADIQSVENIDLPQKISPE